MFENILGMVSNNSGLIVGGGGSAIVLWVLKKIPNDKICTAIETTFESLGRICTLNLSRWSWSKAHWATVETWLIDAIDNIFGSIVRGLVKGLRSDNK